MDPLTAISLSAAVVSFVDFATKLVSDGVDLYHSKEGILPANKELRLAVDDLWKMSNDLAFKPEGGQLSEQEKALVRLAASCKNLSEELM